MVQAEGDGVLEEFEGILLVGHGSSGPEVGVVHDVAVFVVGDGFTFFDPLLGGSLRGSK